MGVIALALELEFVMKNLAWWVLAIFDIFNSVYYFSVLVYYFPLIVKRVVVAVLYVGRTGLL